MTTAYQDTSRIDNCILKISVLSCCIFLFISVNAQNWQQLSDFPSSERDDGVAFVIGNNAYCGTGLNTSWAACNDFYAFDMNTDQWTTIASLPVGEERQYAAAFSSASFGFIAGGVGSSFFNDVWQYDPVLNGWIEKSALPSTGRSGSAYFVINNIAYIIGGKTNSSIAINEVWAYDMINDTWQNKNNLPFGSRWRASAAALNGKGYLIFGRDENNRFCQELFEYDPVVDSWTQISVFPGAGRSYSALKSIAGDLVVLAGLDSFAISHNDMWSFNTSSSAWQQLNSIPSAGRRGGMCFNSSSTIYYTTGVDQTNVRLKETWKCVNPTSIKETGQFANFKLYPDPADEFVVLELPGGLLNQQLSYTLFDNIGKIISRANITHSKTQINLSYLSKGLYFVQCRNENNYVTLKVIKQ